MVTIDWPAFTAWSSLAGGVLIGIAAAMFALLNGRRLVPTTENWS